MSGGRADLGLPFGSLLPKTPGHFLGGEFRPSRSGATFRDEAPATGETLAEIPLGDESDIALAVDCAAAALKGAWGKTKVSERVAMLRRLADLMDANREALARLEALDTGKPISETRPGDIARSAHNCRFFADLAAHQVEPSWTGDDGSLHVSSRERLGVVGLITPWNLPLYLATWKLAPALAQGNAVILKPAELTPLSAMALGTLVQAAGFPPGAVAVIQGHGPQSAGEALVAHPGVRAISFTGETTTGTAIMRAAAPTLKKLSFELGGKGATVVFADADLDQAAATAARAAFRNQGQICLAGSRLLVAAEIEQEFTEKVLMHVRQIRLGDPLDDKTTMGSLIGVDHRAKVKACVEKGRQEAGVELLTGGGIPAAFPKGAYFEPTVFRGVTQNSPLVQDEIFGPVLTVQTFRDEDEALAALNGTKYGLSCSIWTKDEARARRLARGAEMGLVWINTWFLRDLHVAFGGAKKSGVGREGGQWSLDFFSEFKSLTFPSPDRT